MKRYIIILLTILLALSMAACGSKKTKDKSLQQIQAEEGIPVRLLEVQPQTFLHQLRYNALLSGAEESTVQSNLSEVIQSIHAKVGDRVSKGQLIVSFPSNAPAAQYEQASAAYAAQLQAYQRMERLFEKGAISRQELDNLETGLKVSKANLDASQSMIRITSPISGVITALNVNPAQKSYPGQDLFTVSSTSGYKAVIMVPDKDVASIKKGAQVTAEVNGETLSGRITEVGMAVDMYARSVRVEATFPGANRNISYGSNAKICVNVLSQPNTIVVNREHISFENSKAWVWINKDNHAYKVQIETGLNDQLRYEVLAGLEPGDELITEGTHLLSENSRIRVIAEGE